MYSIFWVIIQYYFILLLKFFQFWHWKYFHDSYDCVGLYTCLKKHFLTFWYYKVLRLLCTSTWVLESIISLQNLGYFY